MEKTRSLAYQVATSINLNDLEHVSGGNRSINIYVPTIVVTGHALFPDTIRDTDKIM